MSFKSFSMSDLYLSDGEFLNMLHDFNSAGFIKSG